MIRACALSSLVTLLFCCPEAFAEQLVTPDMIVGDTIAAPLSNTASSVEVGKTVFVDRDQGHCVLCHQIDGLDAEFQGNVGPDLSTVGDRLSAAQIRFRIVDLQSLIPDTVMPSYYRLHDLNQVQEEFQDQTILSAEQIEHLVAYLTSRTQD
ncbi:sulfur oxidation c-type cytochrome SoxX [Ponticaulis sp.]|uniref:sulfur oxidation c-type cytochrome SoxX n=1 Tax=Ponticaulis sp. TaxID=2020902 RepID=UPI000C428AB9|nr:sulfur oxidation c-type cytochrome SoxX [Ponticaulis sp.]MAF56889.1 sulfur oxidation c-type cytochrome SoxX [Ponticaulis sp.]MBN04610.1 sulfur oxidation c-type cytochrome SoxX [Ponticaulis sp.]